MTNTDPSTSNSVVTVGSAATDRDVLTKALLDQLPMLFPGVPNSAWVPILLGQLRLLMATLSGLGLYSGSVNGDKLTFYASVFIGLVAIVWSGYQHVRAKIEQYKAQAVTAAATAAATAHASATCPAGEAMAVAVTPIDPKKPTPLADLRGGS